MSCAAERNGGFNDFLFLFRLANLIPEVCKCLALCIFTCRFDVVIQYSFPTSRSAIKLDCGFCQLFAFL